jgi:predicted Zn-dependent peptidase
MFARRGPGLVGMAARTAVVAGTATAVSGRVARRQANKYAEQDAAYMQQQAAGMEQGVQQAAAAPAAPDYAAELEQLAQLKAQGILTEEEFEAKKKQILGI